MPIEIKELVIKVNVEQEALNQPKTTDLDPLNKEDIINECIERVMAELEYRLGS